VKPTVSTRRSFLGLCAALLAFTSIGFASAPAPERDQRRFEINFLTTMIDHHYGAVKIAMLRLWLMQWYGINDLDHNDRT